MARSAVPARQRQQSALDIPSEAEFVEASAKIAAAINHEHHLFGLASLAAGQRAWDCGHLLIQAKEAIGHGHWEDWVRANLTFDVRMAQKYMKFAREVPRKASSSSLLEGGLSGTDLDQHEVHRLNQEWYERSARRLKESQSLEEVVGIHREAEELETALAPRPERTLPPWRRVQKPKPSNESPDQSMLDHNLTSLGHAIARIEEYVGSLTSKRVEILMEHWDRLGAVIERWGNDGDDGLDSLAEVTTIDLAPAAPPR